MLALSVVAAVAWWPRTGADGRPADAPRGLEVLPLKSAGSWARIRPAAAGDLCLTEGREHTGRYDSAIAVLRPCAEPGGPRVFLQPVRPDLATIKWDRTSVGTEAVRHRCAAETDQEFLVDFTTAAPAELVDPLPAIGGDDTMGAVAESKHPSRAHWVAQYLTRTIAGLRRFGCGKPAPTRHWLP